jgi:osmotically-inducible protein OsmY
MRCRLAVVALLLAGCQPAAETPAPSTAPVPAPIPSTVAERTPAARDEALAAAVRARLALDSVLQNLDIRVEASGARIRLRGAAPDTAVRARIGEVARTVEGVGEIINEISVQLRPS